MVGTIPDYMFSPASSPIKQQQPSKSDPSQYLNKMSTIYNSVINQSIAIRR